MPENTDSRRSVKTADTIFGIIESLREYEGATATEIANEMDIAVSTAHTHLSTLTEKGYVIKRDNEYELSLQFLDLGMYTRNRRPIVTLAEPVLESIADETGESVWLVGEEQGEGVFLASAFGENGVAIGGRVGSRVPLHWIAAGKAILAEYSEERVREIVRNTELEGRASRTITDLPELLTELENIREEGVAFADREYHDGLRAIGAPIVSEEGVLGSVSIAGPANRFHEERFREELPELLLGKINELEIKYATREQQSR